MPNTVTVRLVEDMRFDAISGTGHTIALDSGVASGVGNTGASPMELVLVSLASCGAMDVISILRKMRQDLTAYEVHVSGERAAEHPRVYTRIAMTHRFAGPALEEANLRRAIELSTAHYCPVFAMLSATVAIDVSYEITAPDGAVTSGIVERAPVDSSG